MANNEEGQTLGPGPVLDSDMGDKTGIILPSKTKDGLPKNSKQTSAETDRTINPEGQTDKSGRETGLPFIPVHPDSGATCAPGSLPGTNPVFDDSNPKISQATVVSASDLEPGAGTKKSSSGNSTLSENAKASTVKDLNQTVREAKGASGKGPKPKEESDQTINISGSGNIPTPMELSDATLAPGTVFGTNDSPASGPFKSQGASPARVDSSECTLGPGAFLGKPETNPSDATIPAGALNASRPGLKPMESDATLAPGTHLAGFADSEATLAPGTMRGYDASDATLPPGGLSSTKAPADSDATLAPGSQWGSSVSDQTLGVGQVIDDGSTMAQGSQSGTVPMGQSPASKGPTIRYPGSRGDKTESSTPAVDSKGNRLPVITGYELLGELGRGGMGVVYRARQKGLGRMVALKMVLNNQASQEELDRFMLEAQAVAMVEHPNIVQIYDVGEYNMLPYFSLEFVDGGPLHKKLEGEPQDPIFAGQVMAKLCRAMGFAHSKKILHRDLKPANVLLTKGGEPKITDFGLAKQMDAPDEGHTKAGSIMGTPSYMPPEQAEGKAKDLTNRADIYSLGAILYEFITGRPPFKGRTLLETLQHVRTKEPVPPIQLQPSVPGDLQTICLKALEKDPAKRYATAEEMAEDLESFLKGDPIKARPISAVEKAVRWARRNKPQAALIAMGVAMVCLVVMGGFVYLGLDARNQRLRAERVEKINQDRKDGEALLDQAIREGAEKKWVDSRSTALQARAKLGEDDEVEEVLQKVNSQIELAEGHIETDSQRAQFDSLVNAAYFSATDLTGKNSKENTKDTIENATKALDLFGLKVGEKDFEPKFGEHFDPAQKKRITKECAYLLLLVAGRQMDQNDLENKPIDGVMNLIESAKKGGAGDKSLHLLRTRYYYAKANRGDSEAKFLGDKELKNQNEKKSEEPKDWFLIGDYFYNQGDYKKAKEAFMELSRLNPGDFWSVYYLGIVAVRMESWEEATAYLQNSIALDPAFPYSYTLMGIVQGKLKNYAKAETFFEKAKELLKGEPIGLLINRAALRFDQGKIKEAEADLRQAIKIDSNNWEALNNLGSVLRFKGLLNEALSSFSQADRNAGTELAPMRRLASLMGEFDPPRWQDSIEVYNRIIKKEKDSKKLAKDYSSLASAHFALGELEKAKELLEKGTQLDPENPSIWFLYGNVVNEFAAAQEKILNQVGTVQTKVDKKAVESFYRTAIKAYDTGIELTAKGKSDEAQARNLVEFFRRQNPDGNAELIESRILRSRGFIKARLGDYGGAMFDYTRSLELFGDQPGLRIRRGTAMISKWRDIALQDYNEALKLNPNDLEAYAGRAYVNSILGKHAEVMKDTDILLKTKNIAVAAQVNAACALAQAYRFSREPQLGAPPSSKETQDLYLQNLWLMIQKTMSLVPEPQWKKFWIQSYRGDDSFDPVRSLPEWKALDKKFGGT